MAYTQQPGRSPLKNKAVEYLTDNDKKKNKDKKTVKKYDVSTGKASDISVTKGSASDKSLKSLEMLWISENLFLKKNLVQPAN